MIVRLFLVVAFLLVVAGPAYAAQYLLPDGSYLNDTTVGRNYQSGGVFINETVAAAQFGMVGGSYFNDPSTGKTYLLPSGEYANEVGIATAAAASTNKAGGLVNTPILKGLVGGGLTP